MEFSWTYQKLSTRIVQETNSTRKGVDVRRAHIMLIVSILSRTIFDERRRSLTTKAIGGKTISGVVPNGGSHVGVVGLRSAELFSGLVSDECAYTSDGVTYRNLVGVGIRYTAETRARTRA